MNIFSLVDKFQKLAQAESEAGATINHAIRVEQQAQILAKMVKQGIEAGVTRPEARSYADGLQNVAIDYRQGLQQGQFSSLKQMHAQMMDFFNIIANNYVDENYDPMKQIKESLAYLSQVEFA